jgi:hypothetical protein
VGEREPSAVALTILVLPYGSRERIDAPPGVTAYPRRMSVTSRDGRAVSRGRVQERPAPGDALASRDSVGRA